MPIKNHRTNYIFNHRYFANYTYNNRYSIYVRNRIFLYFTLYKNKLED